MTTTSANAGLPSAGSVTTAQAGTPRPDSRTWLSTNLGGLPLPALLLLLTTAAVSLLWSHYKLFSQDEFFVLQTDSVATVRQLIHIQRTTPISLDPLVYHLLAHASTRLFGATAFALRLPSLLGYLLMQSCLYLTVRRSNSVGAPYADSRTWDPAALFALAFPALTATLFYSAEARPYGLLLGLYALTFLAWQTATRTANAGVTRSSQLYHDERGAPTGQSRTRALTLLTLSVALTLNAHYFGVLLLIPLCAAELFRTVLRRRLDLPVLASIAIGMAAIVFALPFQKPAGEFRQHYYNGGTVSLHAITQSYRALFVDYTRLPLRAQHLIAIAFVVLALTFAIACLQTLRKKTSAPPAAELVFLIVLAALPLFGFLLARFVTHSIEVRYVLGAIIGITILLALTLAPLLDRLPSPAALTVLLFLAIAGTGTLHIRNERHAEAETLATLQLSPALKAAILASPTQRLFFQDMGQFEVASYYLPDPDIRPRLALVYSRENEIRYDAHDTVSLTALHMRAFTGFPILDYETLKRQPGPHIFILFHSGWDWTDQALAADHARITPSGPALGGDAVSVDFHPANTR